VKEASTLCVELCPGLFLKSSNQRLFHIHPTCDLQSVHSGNGLWGLHRSRFAICCNF
jgi:hypothetical protein